MASLALVKKELGKNALIMYLFGVAGMSVLLGLLLDQAIIWLDLDILSHLSSADTAEHELPAAVSAFCFILLTVMAIKPFRRFVAKGKGDAEGGCCG